MIIFAGMILETRSISLDDANNRLLHENPIKYLRHPWIVSEVLCKHGVTEITNNGWQESITIGPTQQGNQLNYSTQHKPTIKLIFPLFTLGQGTKGLNYMWPTWNWIRFTIIVSTSISDNDLYYSENSNCLEFEKYNLNMSTCTILCISTAIAILSMTIERTNNCFTTHSQEVPNEPKKCSL